MIYVTGDIHADLDRFKSRAFKRLKKGDTLLVCGDFGFVWDGSEKEQKLLHWLGTRRCRILFVEGTHDNLDLLARYPETELCEGRARQISGNCYQLLRGEVYTIEERTIFTFGGGESSDMDARVPGETWWQAELPTPAELEHGRETLAAHGNAVDYIVTHTTSSIVDGFLDMDKTHINQLAAFFNDVSKTVKFKQWYFGAHHLDKVLPPLYRAVYQEILPLDSK